MKSVMQLICKVYDLICQAPILMIVVSWLSGLHKI